MRTMDFEKVMMFPNCYDYFRYIAARYLYKQQICDVDHTKCRATEVLLQDLESLTFWNHQSWKENNVFRKCDLDMRRYSMEMIWNFEINVFFMYVLFLPQSGLWILFLSKYLSSLKIRHITVSCHHYIMVSFNMRFVLLIFSIFIGLAMAQPKTVRLYVSVK